MVEIASKTAVWYSTGLFAVPLRWVLIRDPEGGFKTQALLCTDLDADPEEEPMRSPWCARSCGLRSRLFAGRLQRATR
jgi:hypothetical protein